MRVQSCLNFNDLGNDHTLTCGITDDNSRLLDSQNGSTVVTTCVQTVLSKSISYLNDTIGVVSQYITPLVSIVSMTLDKLNLAQRWWVDKNKDSYSLDDAIVVQVLPELMDQLESLFDDNSGYITLSTTSSTENELFISSLQLVKDAGSPGERAIHVLVPESNELRDDDEINVLIRWWKEDKSTLFEGGYTTIINPILQNSFNPVINGKISTTIDNAISFKDMVNRHLDNLNSMTAYFASCKEAMNHLTDKSAFSWSNVATYFTSAISSAQDKTKSIQDIMDGVGGSTDVETIVTWISNKMGQLKDVTASAKGTLTFPRLSSYEVGSIGSGILGGSISVLSTVATVLGTAIGGIWGAVIAVGGLAVNAVNSILSRLADYDDLTLASQSSSYTFEGFPGAYAYLPSPQVLYNFNSFDSAFPYAGVTTPWFIVGQKLILKSEDDSRESGAFLRCVSDYHDILFGSLIKFSNYSATGSVYVYSKTCTDLCAAMGTSKCPNLSKQFATGNQVYDDAYARYSCVINLCWLLWFILNPANQQGKTSFTYSVNDSIISSTFCYYAIMLLQMVYTIVGTDKYTFNPNQWVDASWSALTGNSGTGTFGYALYNVTKALGDGSWRNAPVPSEQSSLGINLYFNYASSLRISASPYSTAQHLYGFSGIYPMVTVPIPSVTLPSYNRGSFWTSLIASTATVVLTTTVAAATVLACRYAIKLGAHHLTGLAESAWYAYTDNPSVSNLMKYRKAVKWNNLVARLTGGTVLSKYNYWDEASTDTDDPTEELYDMISDLQKKIYNK